MPGFGEQLAMQAGEQSVNSIMGLVLGDINNRRQVNQQRRLQNLEIEGQKEMGEYNYLQQMRMWENTNYSAQMEQLKKAGLNPGLIYGMGGAGGATTGSQGGNVTGAHAPQGGGEIQAMLQMGMQRGLIEAQIENVKANTEKTKAETTNVPLTGEKTVAETKSLTQGIENAKAQEELTRMQSKIARLDAYIKNETLDDAIDIVNSQAVKMVHEIDILEQQKILDTTTRIDKQRIVAEQLQEIISKIALTKAQEAATNAGVQQGWTEISQGWQKLTLENKGLDIRQQETNVKAFEAAMKAKYPGAWNVIGRILNEAANALGTIGGIKPDTNRDPKKAQ